MRLARRLTYSHKPDLLKIAIQSQSGQPRLIYIRKTSTLSELNDQLQIEFSFDRGFEFWSYDTNGQKAKITEENLQTTQVGDLLDNSYLELKHETLKDNILNIRYDVFGSHLKKKLLLDSSHQLMRQNLFKNGLQTIKTNHLEKYVNEKFVEDFIHAHRENHRSLTEKSEWHEQIATKISEEQQKLEEEYRKSSNWPVKVMIGLSTVNFAVLFYLTFFVYDWNVVEPISYLISLGAQIALLIGYYRMRRQIDYDFLFQRFLKSYKSVLTQKSFYTDSFLRKSRMVKSLKRVMDQNSNFNSLK